MSKAILFYSFSGSTRECAQQLAEQSGADLIEVVETKKRSALTAFIPGALQAIGQKKSAIVMPEADLNAYDEITVMGPIWASNPAPAVNSIIDLLPAGKTVSLICMSGRGGYDLTKTAALITAKGCNLGEVTCLKEVDK